LLGTNWGKLIKQIILIAHKNIKPF